MNADSDLLEARASELLAFREEQSANDLHRAIGEVLQLLLTQMSMNVVFVSEFAGGRRVFRHVVQSAGVNVIAEGEWAPLQESWCQRVVDGRLPEYIADAGLDPAAAPLLKEVPFPIATHVSTPLVLPSGEVYGTLCAFSLAPNGQPDPEHLFKLKLVARLAAQRLVHRRETTPRRKPT